jgi:hypothetical protein
VTDRFAPFVPWRLAGSVPMGPRLDGAGALTLRSRVVPFPHGHDVTHAVACGGGVVGVGPGGARFYDWAPDGASLVPRGPAILFASVPEGSDLAWSASGAVLLRVGQLTRTGIDWGYAVARPGPEGLRVDGRLEPAKLHAVAMLGPNAAIGLEEDGVTLSALVLDDGHLRRGGVHRFRAPIEEIRLVAPIAADAYLLHAKRSDRRRMSLHIARVGKAGALRVEDIDLGDKILWPLATTAAVGGGLIVQGLHASGKDHALLHLLPTKGSYAPVGEPKVATPAFGSMNEDLCLQLGGVLVRHQHGDPDAEPTLEALTVDSGRFRPLGPRVQVQVPGVGGQRALFLGRGTLAVIGLDRFDSGSAIELFDVTERGLVTRGASPCPVGASQCARLSPFGLGRVGAVRQGQRLGNGQQEPAAIVLLEAVPASAPERPAASP